MIKNVIFDIGNVILNFNRDYLLKHFYNGKDYELLKEKTFYNWELLDEDGLSLEEYFMHYSDGIIDLIRELKQKGYKLYILSNMTRHFINNSYKFPILKEFDGIVYSAPIKMVKPNEEIYKYILDKYNLVANECLFIDDTKTNLVTATRFGIHAFHFDSNTAELRNFIFSK